MYNRVILMGRLTRDPELRQTPGGISMCRFSVAVDRQYAKQGEERQADFFDVTAWRNTADFVCKYFAKGKMIHIEGRLQNNNYTDQNGVKHYQNVVIADSVSFCGDKTGQRDAASDPPPNAPQTAQRSAQSPGQPQAAAPATQQQNEIGLGDLGEFEEILSDGEVPF